MKEKTPFEKFQSLAKGLMHVPKSELDKKINEHRKQKKKMKKPTIKHLGVLFLLVAWLSGCAASGPTHDYYNPMVTDAKFKGEVTIIQVSPENLDDALNQAKADGYAIIGQTIYSGKYPETVELQAQARRVHANHIVYASKLIPAQPGSWHFGFSSWGGGGGTDSGRADNRIVFMGK